MNYTINELMNLDRSKLVEISWNTQLELKKAREKVKLPRRVAEGLDQAKERFKNYSIMNAIQDKKDGYGLVGVYAWVYENPRTLQEGDRKETILKALVNGYEVEEQSIIQELAEMIEEWERDPYSGNTQADRQRLAVRILERIEQENKQSG